MHDGDTVLALVDAIGGNVYVLGGLVIVIALGIVFGLPLLERPLQRRRHRGR